MQRQVGEGLMQSPRTGLCADFADKTASPSNQASPPGGLIRGLEELVFGKYDFVSRAEGMLILLSGDLDSPSDKQLPLSLRGRKTAIRKDLLAGTPHVEMSRAVGHSLGSGAHPKGHFWPPGTGRGNDFLLVQKHLYRPPGWRGWGCWAAGS